MTKRLVLVGMALALLASAPPLPLAFQELTLSFDPLKSQFNADVTRVRLLLLLSPT